MKSLESFKSFLREILINNDGDIKLREHKDIILYAKNLGLDERKLSKLLQEINNTINWNLIEQQKKEPEDPLKQKPSKKKTVGDKQTTAKVEQTDESGKPAGMPVKAISIITASRVLLAVVIVFLIYVLIETANETNQSEVIMYNYADVLAFRSRPEIKNDNIIENISYGTEVKVYSTEQGWAKCALNNKHGFVASEFLLHKKDFTELEVIFGDSNARQLITKTRYKKAILGYFHSKHIMGNMPDETQVAIYGTIQNKEKWQFLLLIRPVDTTLFFTAE